MLAIHQGYHDPIAARKKTEDTIDKTSCSAVIYSRGAPTFPIRYHAFTDPNHQALVLFPC